MLSLALPRPISLSAMSVIAVFAFWAATRRGRAAMTGRYGAGSNTINRGSWVWGRAVVDGSLIMEGPNSSKGRGTTAGKNRLWVTQAPCKLTQDASRVMKLARLREAKGGWL